MMKKRTYAFYRVSLKILLRKEAEFLFLTSATSKCFDSPGGSIDQIEHEIQFPKIIAREIKEELGKNLKYKLGKPVFQFRRYSKKTNAYIFLTIYEATYISGKIKLSSEHSDYQWINPKKYKFKEKEFFNKEEYLAFKKYFQEIL